MYQSNPNLNNSALKGICHYSFFLSCLEDILWSQSSVEFPAGWSFYHCRQILRKTHKHADSPASLGVMTNLWVGLKLHSHGIWQAGDGRRQGDTFWLAHEKTKWSGNNVLPCDVVLFIQNRIYSMKLLWLGDAKYWKSFFRQHCRLLSRFLYILWSLWRKVKQICMAIVAGIHFYLWQC